MRKGKEGEGRRGGGKEGKIGGKEDVGELHTHHL